jgi:peptide/nickel transport system ATP-binding protein
MPDPLLDVRDLRTSFRTPRGIARAVDGVSFGVARGETLAIVGESGCGKSVTALTIMGLLPEPAAFIEGGSILFNGQDLLELNQAQMREYRGSQISMIFQEPMTSLNPVLTVGFQIEETLRVHGMREGTRRRAMELLDHVQMDRAEARLRQYPHELSGGMRQRVMIAIALAGDPKLLIADEPTTALDVTVQAEILRLLAELKAQSNMAMLLITHDLGIVAEVADRVAVMYRTDRRVGADTGPVPGADPSLHQGALRRAAQPRAPWPAARRAGGRRAGPGVVAGWLPLHAALPDALRSVPAQPAGALGGRRGALGALSPLSARPDGAEGAGRGGASRGGPRMMPAKVEPGDTVVSVRKLTKRFPIKKGFLRPPDWNTAVDAVSFDIPSGKTLALVGESGSGKSTVGLMILGLLDPTEGDVFYKGRSVRDLLREDRLAIRRRLQIVFQDPFSSLNARMSVRELLTEGMSIHRIGANAAERNDRAAELLKRVNLPVDALDRYPHEFSGGQRQRIAIARALSVGPKFLVLDEPTSALDVSVQSQVLNLLSDLQRDEGLTYLFITHNLAVVEYLADQVAVMERGKIIEQGPVEQIFDHSTQPYTRRLIGALPSVDPEHRRIFGESAPEPEEQLAKAPVATG